MTSSVSQENYTLQGFLSFSKLFGTTKKTFALAGRYEKWRLTVALLLAIGIDLLPFLQFGSFARLIDLTVAYLSGTGTMQGIFTTTIVLICSTVAPNILSLIYNFTLTVFRFSLDRNLTIYFLQKIASLDIATIETQQYQDLFQKANERSLRVFYDFIYFVIDNIANIFGIAISLVILAFIDLPLLGYAFGGSILALYVQVRYGRDVFSIWDLSASNRRLYFDRRSHFQNQTNLTELKLFQLGNRFLGEVKKLLKAFDDEMKSVERSKFVWECLALVAFALCLGFGIWRVIGLTLAGVLPVGQMLFAYTTYRSFKSTLSDFFRKVGWMTEYMHYVQYWFSIDNLQPKIREKEDAHVLDASEKPPRIEFKNVSFKYSQEQSYAIKDLSFVIEPGKKVAIVGLSGAGKTTLIKLLCRVYDPESGSILVDGVDLRNISLDSWQKKLAVLFQDFSSYQFTVREAIALGDPDMPVDDERVRNAASMAMAHDFIERLPKKYDQLLWKGFEDGVDLSKGERQRMALARTMYRGSGITILDEPTASVDAFAEQQIFETLEKLPDTRTVILISHRFSTVKNADDILVIEHGSLIEHGTHEQLMHKKGRYAELYKIQAESYI